MTVIELPDINDLIRNAPQRGFKKRCGACAHAKEFDGAPAEHPNVMCWRYPPTVLFYGMQSSKQRSVVAAPNQQNMEAVTNSHYPMVGKDNWCGEFSPKTEGEA